MSSALQLKSVFPNFTSWDIDKPSDEPSKGDILLNSIFDRVRRGESKIADTIDGMLAYIQGRYDRLDNMTSDDIELLQTAYNKCVKGKADQPRSVLASNTYAVMVDGSENTVYIKEAASKTAP